MKEREKNPKNQMNFNQDDGGDLERERHGDHDAGGRCWRQRSSVPPHMAESGSDEACRGMYKSIIASIAVTFVGYWSPSLDNLNGGVARPNSGGRRLALVKNWFTKKPMI